MTAYRSADSHPYQQNHMTFPHYYQPQMNVDPSNFVGGHGYPTPTQFCCAHRFPGYWTYTPMPAYPHIPASSPMCFSGGYPAYPEPFYVPYAPPPHYTMELPRYEYDKGMPREYHCCGCPNHPLSQKEGKRVKIEEHEPDAEYKANHAVSPSQLKNHPYPFVWMPPQFMVNKELERPDTTEVGDRQHGPKVWNGWFPLDMNGLANMIQDGNGRKNKNRQIDNSVREAEDGKINRSQQNERNRREIPFPVVWIPDYNMQEGERMEDQDRTSLPNSVKEAPHALDSAPVVSHPSDDASNRSNVSGNDLKVGDSDVTRKETNETSIPVKQMEPQRSEPESHEKRVRDIPVKQAEGDNPGKETQTSVKRQSSSPKKTSKLPPVCLRVDPLPRKKNGNGSSRSPSPSKKGSSESTNETSKLSTSSSMHDKAMADAERQHAPNVSAEHKPKEKTIEVVHMSSEKKDGERTDGSESHGKTQADVKLQKDSDMTEDVKHKNESIKVLEKSSEKILEDHIDGTQSQVTSNTNTEVHKNNSALTSMGESWTNGEKVNGDEAERKANDMITEEAIEVTDAKERKVLSDTEAAVLIQAAYRGFQVRKWEPLKKLKQIAEVSKHVTDVRSSIEALELEASDNEQIIEKERVTIGETIMRLLLKLDTIQGLHPDFRDMRKSLARELTCLQEKLDSVIARKYQMRMKDISIGNSSGEFVQERPEDEVSMAGKDSSEDIIQESHGSSEQQAEEITVSENSSDNIIHATQDMMEQGQDQHFMKNGNPSHDDEKPQSVVHSSPVDEGMCRFSLSVDQVFNEKPEPLPEETANETLNKLSAKASSCDISEVEPETKSELDGIPTEVDELDMKAWEELPRGVIDDDLESDNIDSRKDKENGPSGDDEFAQDGESSKMHDMEELPIGLLDDDDTTDSGKHEETGTSAQVLQTEEGECNPAAADDISQDLPIGLLDGDDTTDSGKHEEIGTSAQVLQTEEGECDPAAADDISKEQEDQSDGESDDWVKVEREQDEFKGDASENVKVENGSREENGVNRVANEDACLEVKEVTVTETPKEVEDKEAQSEQQVIKDDTENREVLSEKMDEECVTSPLLKDGEADANKNIIEENEKLRKMVQRLLEAGNEQLTVISNLTGRVKDLEKKLSKKKRIKTVHCRSTTSKPPSFKKSSNNQLKERITGVAM